MIIYNKEKFNDNALLNKVVKNFHLQLIPRESVEVVVAENCFRLKNYFILCDGLKDAITMVKEYNLDVSDINKRIEIAETLRKKILVDFRNYAILAHESIEYEAFFNNSWDYSENSIVNPKIREKYHNNPSMSVRNDLYSKRLHGLSIFKTDIAEFYNSIHMVFARINSVLEDSTTIVNSRSLYKSRMDTLGEIMRDKIPEEAGCCLEDDDFESDLYYGDSDEKDPFVLVNGELRLK